MVRCGCCCVFALVGGRGVGRCYIAAERARRLASRVTRPDELPLPPPTAEDDERAWLLVGNVGDCRCVLGRARPSRERAEAALEAVPLSVEQKASRADEKARVQQAGGIVFNGRVNGTLEVRVCGREGKRPAGWALLARLLACSLARTLARSLAPCCCCCCCCCCCYICRCLMT